MTSPNLLAAGNLVSGLAPIVSGVYSTCPLQLDSSGNLLVTLGSAPVSTGQQGDLVAGLNSSGTTALQLNSSGSLMVSISGSGVTLGGNVTQGAITGSVIPLWLNPTAFAGDLTGSAARQTVVSLQAGTISITSGSGALTWANTATGSIAQASALSGSRPVSMTVSPQAPYAYVSGSSPGTAAQNTPGSFIVNLAASGMVGTVGNNPTMDVKVGGNVMARISSQAPYSGAALYLYQTGSYQLYSDGAHLYVQSPLSYGDVFISHAGYVSQVNSYYGVQVCNAGSTDLGGGRCALGFNKATTNPTTATLGGAVLYADCTTGDLCIYPPGATSTTGTKYDHGVSGSYMGPTTTPQLGGGVGVMGIANAVTNPSGAVSGGGVLYVSGGLLYFLSAAGNVTKLTLT